MGPIIVLGLVALLIVAVWNPGGIRTTVFNWIRGGGERAKQLNPALAVEGILSKRADEIKAASDSLDEYRGLVSQLERKVAADQDEMRKQTSRKNMYLDQNNDEGAKDAIKDSKAAEANLAKHQQALTIARTNYDGAVQRVKRANQQFQEDKEHAKSMGADLELSLATARATDSLNKISLDGALQSELSSTFDIMQDQTDKNNAKAQVAADLGTDGSAAASESSKLADYEAEQELAAEKARRAAQKGTQAAV